MAPKNTPPIAKQNLILRYIQQSLTVHNIKELEKSLPAVASISGMQVKDYLQALSDEGKIRVEKIGSGNWYWSFLSEEKITRDNTINGLESEKKKIDAAVESLKAQIAAEDSKEGQNDEREELLKTYTQLEEEVAILRKELEGFRDRDPLEIERKRKEADEFKAAAERWTDNIGILESKLREMLGGNLEQFEAIRLEIYGSEYMEGEGLMEL